MPESQKIAVNANAGIIDLLTAAGRYLVVIAGAVPILLKLLGAHDFAGLISYFRSSDGATLTAAASALVALAYGLYKTHKRGAQLGQAATDPANRNIVPK